MRTPKWMVGTIVALVVLVPVALKLSRGETRSVEIAEVASIAISPSILASGTLAYQSEVTLVPEVIGRVREVYVTEGEIVTQGQLLLRLDPATSLAEIAQLEAAKRQSQLNIERERVNVATQTAKARRYEQLRKSGLVDASTFEEINSQRQLAEVELSTSRELLKQTDAQLKQARERLAKTEFRAPISGTVTAVHIKVGETAVPSAMSIAGSELVVVADTTSMYADVNVDEADIARVEVGQEASIVPAAFPGEAWQGKVEQVALSPRQASGQSKNYPVKIRLADSRGHKFHPGMSCRVEIATRSVTAPKMLGVPVQAVRYEQQAEDQDRSSASVFVVKDGKVHKRTVETGAADDANIEIRSGLVAGEHIVIGPARVLRFLGDGDAVSAAGPLLAAQSAKQ